MNRNNNIFLVGFMGSGKTTLGKQLANKLDKQFFDLDAEIEAIEKSEVSVIFDKKGENYFRKIETEVLIKLISNNDNFVISLGGGTPCFNDNMKLINLAGTSIYLKYNSEILANRLVNNKTERPLIKNLSEGEVKAFVNHKLNERELFYEQSNHVLEGSNLSVEDLASLLQ
jgi:shikimate kinase